jgi:hypothetical protein
MAMTCCSCGSLDDSPTLSRTTVDTSGRTTQPSSKHLPVSLKSLLMVTSLFSLGPRAKSQSKTASALLSSCAKVGRQGCVGLHGKPSAEKQSENSAACHTTPVSTTHITNQ